MFVFNPLPLQSRYFILGFLLTSFLHQETKMVPVLLCKWAQGQSDLTGNIYFQALPCLDSQLDLGLDYGWAFPKSKYSLSHSAVALVMVLSTFYMCKFAQLSVPSHKHSGCTDPSSVSVVIWKKQKI